MSGKWALLLLALGWSTGTAAQTWRTTDWTVECLAVNEGTCEGTEGAGANAYFEDALEGASGWLGGLGFRGPAIEYRTGTDTYVAYVSDAHNEEKKPDENSIGVYFPDEARMYLTSDHYFAMGEGDTPQERAGALADDIPLTATVVHELFHAVQYAYYRDGNRVPDWITEGMAQAIQLAWVRRTMPDAKMRGGARAFDRPLHKPKDKGDAYLTSRFWRGIGRLLGPPDEIGYLDAILRQDLESNRGLGGVDQGLREFDPDGLYNLYPAFIARSTNNVNFFDKVGQVDLVYDDSTKVEKSVRGTVREVAANAVEVSVHVPVGKMARLEIEFAKNHDDLHLILDDKRVDDFAGRSRNMFHANVDGKPGVQTFLVRVANVARTAVDSRARQYGLDFTLMPTTSESQCTFSATFDIEPLGGHEYFFSKGKKLPIRRTESVVGVATIDDDRHHLSLSFDDKQGNAGSGQFTIDIASLGIGGAPGQVVTRGEFGYTSPEKGPYDVQLGILENADPGDLAEWDEMTLREQIDSGVGFPERLAMRRLRGEFRATRIQTPECCVGYAQTITGTFDAGNGPYHCEGGIEMMEQAFETMMDMFNETPERKADPGKLDGLLD